MYALHYKYPVAATSTPQSFCSNEPEFRDEVPVMKTPAFPPSFAFKLIKHLASLSTRTLSCANKLKLTKNVESG